MLARWQAVFRQAVFWQSAQGLGRRVLAGIWQARGGILAGGASILAGWQAVLGRRRKVSAGEFWQAYGRREAVFWQAAQAFWQVGRRY